MFAILAYILVLAQEIVKSNVFLKLKAIDDYILKLSTSSNRQAGAILAGISVRVYRTTQYQILGER